MKTGKVGIAQFVLRNRDSLCMLIKATRPSQGLVLNALRFASEIRSMEELSLPSSEKISPGEVALALKLIEGMAVPLIQQIIRTLTRTKFRKLIEAKGKSVRHLLLKPRLAFRYWIVHELFESAFPSDVWG
jgi:DNA end-binding protein Ku